ncbi:MarR family transcriptional regulator [Ktedonosporobacter rubrisoli]|uniref:MarR family transcriptional regulator n=1 Tax=Ktedonosporobacter rubrisoli TaxID=2509675 RepID=A0A4P6JK57_KTERU|nr:MarR family transcriptional regulator [Ktedonosporobacter rubrisoli]QBD75524.1 MarR family transcriptional regulator [Ktedonosporobacter rubrisoli]
MDRTQHMGADRTAEKPGTGSKKDSLPLLSALHETARAVEAALNAVLAPINFSGAQWAILHLIDEHPGVAGAEIARQGKISPAAVTTMLKRLEATGMIERHAQTRGRIIETHLTAYGRERLLEADAIVKQVEQQLSALLGERELSRVLADMAQFMNTLNLLARSSTETEHDFQPE